MVGKAAQLGAGRQPCDSQWALPATESAPSNEKSESQTLPHGAVGGLRETLRLQVFKSSNILTLISMVRVFTSMRVREGKSLASGHTAKKWGETLSLTG